MIWARLGHLLVRIYTGARLQPGKGHPAQSLFPYEHCHLMPQRGLTLKILEEKLGGKETQCCITIVE
uniref:CDAN1 interacting nuclease 1 n=1 Tax=Cebus imitator TaxID=2715852 RepID=A0A2K5RR88_CEBIM